MADVGRRSLLGILGIGSAAAASGARLSSGSELVSSGGVPRAASVYGASAGSAVDPLRELEADRKKAASWLLKNGLPDHVRQRLARNAREQAFLAPIPPEIEVYRSFAPHLKRRLYAEQLARLAERQQLENRVADIADEAKRALLPDFVRNCLGWL